VGYALLGKPTPSTLNENVPLEKGGLQGGLGSAWGSSAPAFGNFHDNPVTLTEPELVARGHGTVEIDVVQSRVWRFVSGLKP